MTLPLETSRKKTVVVSFERLKPLILVNPANVEEWKANPKAVVDPDLKKVRGLPLEFWKLENGEILPMSDEEIQVQEENLKTIVPAAMALGTSPEAALLQLKEELEAKFAEQVASLEEEMEGRTKVILKISFEQGLLESQYQLVAERYFKIQDQLQEYKLYGELLLGLNFLITLAMGIWLSQGG